MKFEPRNPPRVFRVGSDPVTEISDTGSIALDALEQVTFISASGSEYDVARMSWGYYATPSTNARLVEKGFRSALVMNAAGRCYVILVEVKQVVAFQGWLKREAHRVIAWLDNEEDLRRIGRGASADPKASSR